jgi:hypothetical protein
MVMAQTQFDKQDRAMKIAGQSADAQDQANRQAATDAEKRSQEAKEAASAAEEEATALRSELEAIRKQMEQEGAVIRVSGSLEVWNLHDEAWEDLSSVDSVAVPPADSSQAYLVILATNEGRYKATVSAVGISSEPLQSKWTGFYECPDPETREFMRCDQRVVIEPQEQKFFRVRINDGMFRDVICGAIRDEGLDFSVGLLGAPIARGTVPQALHCV